MVDAPRAKPVLCCLVTRTGAAELIFLRHPNVVIDDFTVARRFTPNRYTTDDVYALGFLRNDDLRHFLVKTARIIRVSRAAHDDIEIGRMSVGGKPLVPVDDPFVAVEHRSGLQRSRIRPCVVRFRH